MTRNSPAARFGSKLVPDMSSILQGLVDAGVAPGLAAEVRDARRRLIGAAGVSGITTRLSSNMAFPIGCAAKVMTAVVALELAESGGLDLDEPVAILLPELEWSAKSAALSCRHLLSHTGGFSEPIIDTSRGAYTWDQYADAFRKGSQLFDPGMVWSFSHSGYVLLARIVEQRKSRPHAEILGRRFLDPLRAWTNSSGQGDPVIDVVGHRRSIGNTTQPSAIAPASAGVLDMTSSPAGWTLAEGIEFCRHLFASSRIFERPLSLRIRRQLVDPAVTLPPTLVGVMSEEAPVAYSLGVAIFPDSFGWTWTINGTTMAMRHQSDTGATLALGMTVANAAAADRVASEVSAGIENGREPRRPRPAVRTVFRPEQLVGAYRALAPVGIANVSSEEGSENLKIRLRVTPQMTATAVISLSADGQVGIVEAPPAFSISIDVDSTGAPVLCVGKSAYKKLKDRQPRHDQSLAVRYN